eukprot:4103729-Amphidinium_carterae.2
MLNSETVSCPSQDERLHSTFPTLYNNTCWLLPHGLMHTQQFAITTADWQMEKVMLMAEFPEACSIGTRSACY